MRILVDCCNYFGNNHNLGDVAVFQALARRFEADWPGAQIDWITRDPERMRQALPGVAPLALRERHHWELGGTTRPLPAAGMERALVRWRRRWSAGAIHARLRRGTAVTPEQAGDLERLLGAYRRSDLVLAVGGAFGDAFAQHGCGMLDTLRGGLEFGRPTALLSVAFEPITSVELLARARAVLPQLDLIGVREPQHSPAWLRALGVQPQRIHVTGDAALTLAHEPRVQQCGDSIGVGLRQARYSAVGPASLPELRAVLRAAAERLGAPLRPLPISLFGPSDPRSLARLLHESDDEAVGGIELDSPAAVIRAVGRCRVVVTGSYHPAVFALAQGIPTIGLTRSLHYQCKLRGLAALFGHGCRVIHLGGPRSAELLARTIDEFWGHADGMRPDLLAAARRQLAAGDTAHRELRRIVGPAWLRFALGA